MEVGMALCIAADVINLLKGMGIIDVTSYKLRAPSASEDSIIATRVTAILVNYNITIPDKVETVIAMIPMILNLAGVK